MSQEMFNKLAAKVISGEITADQAIGEWKKIHA